MGIVLTFSMVITLLCVDYSNIYAVVETGISGDEKINKNLTYPSSMLTSPFYIENTKSTNLRVLSIDPQPTIEVTYEGNSTINDEPTQTFGTIIDTMNEDGMIYSDGKAMILTSTGKIITYKTQSIGQYNPDGSFSDSGVIFFNLPIHYPENNKTDILSNDFAKSYLGFNNLLGIYKKTVDPLGNGLTTVWKWNKE